MSYSRMETSSETDAGDARDKVPTRTQSGAPDYSSSPQMQARRIAELEAELAHYRDLFERVVTVTSEAANGNLEARILHCSESDNLHTIAVSVNHLLDMTDAFLREAGAALEHASQGKFFRRVLLRGMRGAFREKSQLINQATEMIAQDSGSLHQAGHLIGESAKMAQDAVRQASEASAVVKQLGEASARIGSVVQSISQVAWQTKLLALNAKIEASRAGDAGRGFAVVAHEVRDLAQKTSTATDDISREIAIIQKEVEHTSQVMEAVSKTIGQMQQISANVERAVATKDSNTPRRANS